MNKEGKMIDSQGNIECTDVVDGFLILDARRKVKCSEATIETDPGTGDIIIRHPLWIDGARTDKSITFRITIAHA